MTLDPLRLAYYVAGVLAVALRLGALWRAQRTGKAVPTLGGRPVFREEEPVRFRRLQVSLAVQAAAVALLAFWLIPEFLLQR